MPPCAGTAFSAYRSIGSLSDTNWQVVGLGDFDAPLVLVTETVPNPTVGEAYDVQLEVTGGLGEGTYAWSIDSGTLPDGLGLGASTGAITGTPTTADTYTFEVLVESGGRSVSRSYEVTVSAPNLGSLIPVDRWQPPTKARARIWACLVVFWAGRPMTNAWRIL